MTGYKNMQFAIFHGSLGLKDGNWFPDLRKKLSDMGQEVFCPQYPVDDFSEINKKSKTKQNLDSWMKTFEKEVLPHLSKKEKICFIGHSLGNLFILHVLDKHKIKLDCGIFVSPCLDKLGLIPWQYDLANTTFYKTDFDFNKLVKLVPTSYVLYSDNDPYIEPRRALHFAKVMESSSIFVRKAGHLNSEVNLNEFPLVFDLCITRLNLTLYQRFALGRTEESIAQNIINSNRKYLAIGPEEEFAEGRFHFMNINKTGFATFISNAEEWDPENEYFTQGRKASLRGVKIARVYVIKNKKDLNRKILLKQILFDLKANIKVCLINNKILKSLGAEEDFGIWDDEYICIIRRNRNGKALNLFLDSRIESIIKALLWRDKILKNSVEIKSLSDISRWKNKL